MTVSKYKTAWAFLSTLPDIITVLLDVLRYICYQEPMLLDISRYICYQEPMLIDIFQVPVLREG